MNPARRRLVSTSAFLVPVLVSALFTPVSGAAETDLYPTDYVWRDVDGNPLPFQDTATILEALRTAEIVEQEQMSRGIAKNVKLLLEYEGVRFKAVLRMIDVTEKEKTGSLRMVVKYRDSHIFEAAAFELSELLGLGRVPPTVQRGLAGHDGTVQIWMEGVAPEDVMLKEGRLTPPDKVSWWRQKGLMWVFDALIANTDRNQGNLLIDEDWNLWFIDHTRAFRETSSLMEVDELDRCERKLWNALQQADEDEIRARLEPFLTSKEMTKLFLRRDKLIKHFQKKIRKKGEEKVIYDLD
jgi:hypothetical protein